MLNHGQASKKQVTMYKSGRGSARLGGPPVSDEFRPVLEKYEVPLPTYLITYRGDVVRTMAKAADVREYLADERRRASSDWACLVNVNGRIREVCRNPVPSRGGS